MELLLYSCIIGWTLKTIHAALTNLWGVFVQIFMPYWNFEHTKAVTLHFGKVGGGIYMYIDPATEVTHFGLN